MKRLEWLGVVVLVLVVLILAACGGSGEEGSSAEEGSSVKKESGGGLFSFLGGGDEEAKGNGAIFKEDAYWAGYVTEPVISSVFHGKLAAGREDKTFQALFGGFVEGFASLCADYYSDDTVVFTVSETDQYGNRVGEPTTEVVMDREFGELYEATYYMLKRDTGAALFKRIFSQGGSEYDPIALNMRGGNDMRRFLGEEGCEGPMVEQMKANLLAIGYEKETVQPDFPPGHRLAEPVVAQSDASASPPGASAPRDSSRAMARRRGTRGETGEARGGTATPSPAEEPRREVATLSPVSRAPSTPSSARPSPAPPPPAVTSPGAAGGSATRERPGVTLYADARYGGRKEKFFADDSDLSDNRIGSDTTSSIRVDPGCEVILFQKKGFRGRSLATDDSISELRLNLREKLPGRHKVGNDAVSSIKVICSR